MNVPLKDKASFLHRSSRPEQFPGAVIALVWLVSGAAAFGMLLLIAQCSRIILSYWQP